MSQFQPADELNESEPEGKGSDEDTESEDESSSQDEVRLVICSIRQQASTALIYKHMPAYQVSCGGMLCFLCTVMST